MYTIQNADVLSNSHAGISTLNTLFFNTLYLPCPCQNLNQSGISKWLILMSQTADRD